VAEKTEEPTAKRLRKAMSDGDIPVSAALVGSVAFFLSISLLPSTLAGLLSWVATSLRYILETPQASHTPGRYSIAALWFVLLFAVPVLVAAAGAAALAGVVQGGGRFQVQPIVPQLSRLSPIRGLGKLVSKQQFFRVFRSLLTTTAVCFVTWSALKARLGGLAHGVGAPAASAAVAVEAAGTILRSVGLVLVASALVDVVITRRSWKQRLRMGKDEVKREHKESEGDPQLKAARERAHHELLEQAAIHSVKNATVVVVNPTHLAAAIRYQEGEQNAPSLLAKGEGDFAARIIEAARQYGVPVVRDVPLARALMSMEIGDEIPESLYEAVAEVLRSLWEQEAPPTTEEPP